MILNRMRSLSTKLYKLVNSYHDSRLKKSRNTPCVLCLGPTHHLGICQCCALSLPQNTHACGQCAQPLPSIADGLYCGRCQRKPPPFHQTVAPWLYRYPVSQAVSRYKFQGDRASGRALTELLARHIRQEGVALPDALIPCPLYPTRFRQRGFNQAAEMAEWLGKALGVPVLQGQSRRIAMGAPQASLNRRGRMQNLRASFDVRGRIPTHVAIIDDVMTTGATVAALARVLKAGGAQQVDVWVIARTP